MADDLLYCCRMRDESGDPGAASELLNALGLNVSTWENLEEQTVWHTVYSSDSETGAAVFDRLRKIVLQWRALGVCLGDPIRFEMKREDWSESWKKFFPILHVSDRLVIKPGWLDYIPSARDVVVEIDPGMVFGTGQHATTAFCLRMIDRLSGEGAASSLLDAGCGSGILSIAGAKLGFSPIDAFDNDPDAVRVAGENLSRNGIAADFLTPELADAASYCGRSGGYDLVVANILGNVLTACRSNIASWVSPGKFLALAGILNAEFQSISDAFVRLGFVEIRRCSEKEWTGGLFQKNRGGAA